MSEQPRRTPLGMLNDAVRLVLDIKESMEFVSHYIQADEPVEEVSRDDWHKAREAARMTRLEPRAVAVAKARSDLEELWRAGLRTLVYRHIPDAEDYAVCCDVRSGFSIPGPSVLTICRWGCDGCCNRVLQNLKVVRDGEALAGTLREVDSREREDGAEASGRVGENEILATEIREEFGVPAQTLQRWKSTGKLPELRRTEGRRVRVFDRGIFRKLYDAWKARRG